MVKNEVCQPEIYFRKNIRDVFFSIVSFFRAINAGQLLKESSTMAFQSFSLISDKNHGTEYIMSVYICVKSFYFFFYYKQVLTAVNNLCVYECSR